MIDNLLLTHIEHLQHPQESVNRLRLRFPTKTARQYASVTNRGGMGGTRQRSDTVKFYQLGDTITQARLVCDYTYGSRTKLVCRYDYDWRLKVEEDVEEPMRSTAIVEEIDVMATALNRIVQGLNGQPIGHGEFEQLRDLLALGEPG